MREEHAISRELPLHGTYFVFQLPQPFRYLADLPTIGWYFH